MPPVLRAGGFCRFGEKSAMSAAARARLEAWGYTVTVRWVPRAQNARADALAWASARS
jgi:hypothetical protein